MMRYKRCRNCGIAVTPNKLYCGACLPVVMAGRPNCRQNSANMQQRQRQGPMEGVGGLRGTRDTDG